MTSKTTKFYSTAIAAALVATAVVPAASASTEATAQPTGTTGQYKLTIATTAGDIVKIYEAGKTEAHATATASGTSTDVTFTVTEGKTYTYKLTTGDPAAEGAATAITLSKGTSVTTGVTVVGTDVTAAGKDTIKISGLPTDAANEIKIYKPGATADADVEFGTFTSPKGKSEVVITLKDKELNDLRIADTETVKNKGQLKFTVKTGEKAVSDKSAVVTFDLATVSTVLDAGRTYAINNVTAKDTVTISGVKAKDTVTFYEKSAIDFDGTGENATVKGVKANAIPLQVQKVSKSGAVTVTFKTQFTTQQITDGLYATVTADGSYQSAPIKVPLAAESETTKVGTGKADNVLGTAKDTVEVKDIESGATVTLYAKSGVKDAAATPLELASDAISLGTAKADKNGKAVLKVKGGFTDAQVTDAKLFYTVTNIESKTSAPAAIDLGAEPRTTFTVTESDATADPAVVGNVTISNLGGIAKDTIEIAESTLPEGTTVNVYAIKDVNAAEGTAEATLKEAVKPIATAKVDSRGKASIKIKGGLEQYETDQLYISAVEKDKKASVLTKLTKIKPATSSDSLDNKFSIENLVGKKSDSVTVTGTGFLKKGDVVNLYAATSYDSTKNAIKDGEKPVATVKASKDGADAVLKLKAGFTTEKTVPASKETYYLTLEQADKKASTPTAVEITKEAESKLAAANVTFTNNIDLKDTITINHDTIIEGTEKLVIGAKDVVNVYAKSTDTKPIATVTAKGTGNLVITLKDDYKAGDKVYVTYTKVGTHESPKTFEVTVPAFTAENTTNNEYATGKKYIDKNFVTVDDNGAKSDATVTVANAKSGVTYTVYDGTKAIGSAKAASNGILVVKLDKGTNYSAVKDKKIEMTVREYSKAESAKVEIQAASTSSGS